MIILWQISILLHCLTGGESTKVDACFIIKETIYVFDAANLSIRTDDVDLVFLQYYLWHPVAPFTNMV